MWYLTCHQYYMTRRYSRVHIHSIQTDTLLVMWRKPRGTQFLLDSVSSDSKRGVLFASKIVVLSYCSKLWLQGMQFTTPQCFITLLLALFVLFKSLLDWVLSSLSLSSYAGACLFTITYCKRVVASRCIDISTLSWIVAIQSTFAIDHRPEHCSMFYALCSMFYALCSRSATFLGRIYILFVENVLTNLLIFWHTLYYLIAFCCIISLQNVFYMYIVVWPALRSHRICTQL